MEIKKTYRNQHGRYEYRLTLYTSAYSDSYKGLDVYFYAPKKRNSSPVMREDIENLPKEWLEDIKNELIKTIRNLRYS